MNKIPKNILPLLEAAFNAGQGQKYVEFKGGLSQVKAYSSVEEWLDSDPPLPEVKDWTTFVPSTLYDWNGRTDVRGCRQDPDGIESNVENPDFWTVYVQQNDSEEDDDAPYWIACADFNTEAQAREFQGFLETILHLSIPAPNQ